MKNTMHTKNTLLNFTPCSGASDEYCSGVFVGIVSTMMDCGKTWADAIKHTAVMLPHDSRELTAKNLPETWVEHVKLARVW